MNCLTVHLHLQSPLLISQLGGGDPNSSIGYAYIPGSTLRGAIIGRYLTSNGKDVEPDTVAVDEEFRRLFLSGEVCFLNGYPLSITGERSLPMPLSWQQPKDAPKGSLTYDWAVSKPVEQPTESDANAKAKLGTNQAWKSNSDSAFIDQGTQVNERVKPTTQINIHIARQDRQRPTAGDAAIFRYDALAKDQIFAALIIANDPADLAMIQALLPDRTHLPLGRSRRAGYGWVEVRYRQSATPVQVLPCEWRSAAWPYTAETPPKKLIVTLLSDTLIQDPETGAYGDDLEPILGAVATDRFVRLHKVGGFNRKWNLPLPQAEAIAAGSVFVYDYSEALGNKLKEYCKTGMGARRVEGFGRIAINWQHQPTLTLLDQSDLLNAQKDATQQADIEVFKPPQVVQGRALAEQMVTRLLRADLDRLLLQAINDNLIDRRGLRNAQLARVRVVARHALERQHLVLAVEQGQIVRLNEFLKKLKDSARNQLQRARVQRYGADGQCRYNEPLYSWLTQLADTPVEIWNILEASLNLDLDVDVPEEQKKKLSMPAIGQYTAQLTIALAIEYALRLIDGIAQLATREGHDE